MVKSARRSTLQLELLMQLREKPASSTLALADRVASSRPSVSRSLHTLLRQGLVRREGRKWSLSANGESEAATAVTRLNDDAQEFVEVAGKKLRAITRATDIMLMIPDVQDAMRMSEMNLLGNTGISNVASMSLGQTLDMTGNSSLNRTMAAVAGLGDYASAADSMLGQVSSMSASDSLLDAARESVGAILGNRAALASGSVIGALNMTPAVAGVPPEHLLSSSALASVGDLLRLDATLAASPILTAQDAFASFLSGLPAEEQSVSYGLIAEQTSLLSTALDNVLTLGRMPSTAQLISDSLGAEYAQVPDHLLSIANSLSDVFQDQLNWAHSSAWERPPIDVAELLLLSTIPVTNYSSAVRHLTEPEARSKAHPPSRHKPVGNERLDPLLARIDPDFVAKRQGSWMALDSSNPDRLSQAASSQRNLLTQLLRTIVPDLDVDDETRGSKIKAKARVIMHGSDSQAEHVMHVANAVYSNYAVLSKYDHTNQKHESFVRALLHTAEGLMEMILVYVPFDDQRGVASA